MYPARRYCDFVIFIGACIAAAIEIKIKAVNANLTDSKVNGSACGNKNFAPMNPELQSRTKIAGANFDTKVSNIIELLYSVS
jgi:K+-transporting ATPase c subunit